MRSSPATLPGNFGFCAMHSRLADNLTSLPFNHVAVCIAKGS